MKVLITGACGFVGSLIARRLKESIDGVQIVGIDNLCRDGSQINRAAMGQLCQPLIHADLRAASDFETLPDVDWVVDCAALPSVLAGTSGYGSSRQLVEHNLGGTLNLLEYCRRTKAGLILLSTSRVYSIDPLSRLPLVEGDRRFDLANDKALPTGISDAGIAESFSTTPPVSLYGATKLASETMAIEYGNAFEFPVRINRCGVLAGAGQFGRADQGIFSFWIHSHRAKQALRYIGSRGTGFQVRDCLHPDDLASLVRRQMIAGIDRDKPIVANVSGGVESSMSLLQLTQWCDARFGSHPVVSSTDERPFDLPWIVLDSSLVRSAWDWKPQRTTEQVLDEIAEFAHENPSWLELSS
ncbi:NAD-dependent epimerase/dehydratase family protein [Stieleria sp. TO1_6]|uniref:NAD-dependent epimerase/dehydratase family protein n=1 Tax=Stieleria tagensis TaxID=2956795 RepID=UPI00209B3123|nr:NAD-dependent epimerase/dehydratase family protein [Stieleria tagensis]MCO8123269.1 NAD-dependent epimerase/dehydratase family protein [Stieleria tagensis]